MAFGFDDFIGIASSILGSGGGSSRTDASLANNRQFEQNKYFYDRQEAFTNKWNNIAGHNANLQFNALMDYEKKKTQWRVADARNAGIHPLYALGQSSGVSPVSFSPGGGPSIPNSSAMQINPDGNHPGTTNAVLGALNAKAQRAYQKQQSARQSKLDAIAGQESYYRSYKDWAIAQEALSNAARARQNLNVNQDAGGSVQRSTLGPTGKPEYERSRIVQGDPKQPYRKSGRPPGQHEVYLGDDIYGKKRYGAGSHDSTDLEEDLGALSRKWRNKLGNKHQQFSRQLTNILMKLQESNPNIIRGMNKKNRAKYNKRRSQREYRRY